MTIDLEGVFYCPFHEGPVVVPCGLEQCDLWVTKHHLNCGYVAYREFLAEEGSDELSWETIGKILGYESKEIEHLAKQAYEILRQLTVQEQVPAEWSLLRNSKRCVVCNRPLEVQREPVEAEEGLELEEDPEPPVEEEVSVEEVSEEEEISIEQPIFEQGWGWCSERCHQWLPTAAVEAEARWGTWFKKLLSQWRQLNVKTIERLTGLNKDTIRWLLWQHLGWENSQETNQWIRCEQPLVPNPRIPCVKEIVQRIDAAEQWGKR
jgi:hypothetical protein